MSWHVFFLCKFDESGLFGKICFLNLWIETRVSVFPELSEDFRERPTQGLQLSGFWAYFSWPPQCGWLNILNSLPTFIRIGRF